MNKLVYRTTDNQGRNFFSLRAPKKGRYTVRQVNLDEKQLLGVKSLSKALGLEWCKDVLIKSEKDLRGLMH
jgi:hypothetical protein